jgi:hypothetical protein
MLRVVLASLFAASAAQAGVVRTPVKAGPVTPAWGALLGSVVSAPTFGSSPLQQFNPALPQSRAGFTPVISKLEAQGLSVEVLQSLQPEEKEAKVRAAVEQVTADFRLTVTERLKQEEFHLEHVAELWTLSNLLSPYLEEEQKAAVAAAHVKAKERLNKEEAARLNSHIEDMTRALGSSQILDHEQGGVTGKVKFHKSGLLPFAKSAAPKEKSPAPVETSMARPVAASQPGLWEKISSLWSRSWNGFYRRFDKNIRSSLSTHYDVYSRSLENGESYTSSLRDDYGFVFGSTKDKTQAPTPEEFFAVYNRRVDKLVASGIVKEDEVARPGIVFWSPTGKPSIKKPGENVSWTLRPDRHFLGDFRWFKLLGDGVIAFGNPVEWANGGHTLTEHDIAHILALEQHPRYMAEVVKGLRRLTSNPALLGADGQFHYHLNRRLFFVTEYLSVIKPSAKGALLAKLKLPKAQEGRRYPTVAEAVGHMESLTDDQLHQLKFDLENEYPKAVEHVGGASKDLITMAKSRHGLFGTSLPSLHRRLGSITDSPESKKREYLVLALAKLQVALLAFSDISPEQFARESLTETVDPKSKTYEIMAGLGLFDESFSAAYSR